MACLWDKLNSSRNVGMTYSCRELRKTLDVYSRRREVLERLRATLFGLENAKAVPRGL